MKDDEWGIKKQVKIMVEKYSFDFFISKAYKMENVKEIFSMTIPGYPNLLDLKNFEAIFHENQMDIQKFTHPSITVSLGDVKIFNKYLIPSVFYEIDPIKRIKSDKRIDILTAKTETELLSNPYAIFSFNDYMELSFKKINSKHKILSSGDVSYQEYAPNMLLVSVKNFMTMILNLLCKCLSPIQKMISRTEPIKTFCILIIFDSLFSNFQTFLNGNRYGKNSSKKISNLEMVFKLIVKFIFIIAIKNFLKFEILPLDSVSNSTNTFKKEMSVEKEISLIKTLIHGIIRSGNMCSI